MATIIIITPPKKPAVQPQGGTVTVGQALVPINVPGTLYEVPDDLSTADALRYIADQVES